MNQLVIKNENGELTTTSKIIAEVFGKEHKNVIRAIENANCSNEFRRLNFEELLNTNNLSRNKSYYYELTETGCNFIVMKFTGEKAGEYQEAFVNAFQAMKEELQNKQPALPKTYAEALLEAGRLALEVEKQQSQIETMKPLAEFGGAIAQSEASMKIGECAKIFKNAGIDTGQNKLFTWLRDNGFLMKNNVPYQQYVNQGLFEVKEGLIRNGGKDRFVTTTLITGKGQEYFLKKLTQGVK